MGLSGSTIKAPRGKARIPELVAGCSPGELKALLVPMVARAARTGRGPASLVRWLRRRAVRPTEQAARALAEDLTRRLFDEPGPLNETLDDV